MSTLPRNSTLPLTSRTSQRHKLRKKEPMFDMLTPVASTTAVRILYAKSDVLGANAYQVAQQTEVRNATLVGPGVAGTAVGLW
jgi:hypothetical protein